MSSFPIKGTVESTVPKPSVWSIERVVALFTPVIGIAAGAASTGIGSAVGIPKADFVALFVAGTTAAVGGALTWLRGRQKFVNFVTDAEHVAKGVVDKIQANQLAGPALTDIEGILKAHTSQIIGAVGKSVHAPASAEEIAQQIVGKLLSGQGGAAAQTAAATQAAASPVAGS